MGSGEALLGGGHCKRGGPERCSPPDDGSGRRGGLLPAAGREPGGGSLLPTGGQAVQQAYPGRNGIGGLVPTGPTSERSGRGGLSAVYRTGVDSTRRDGPSKRRCKP